MTTTMETTTVKQIGMGQGAGDEVEVLTKEAILEFQKMGFKIMIWTTRAQKDVIKNACINAGIPFDYINENPNQPPEINPSKPVADYYIDDRALHFRSWDQTLKEVKARERHDPYYREES